MYKRGLLQLKNTVVSLVMLIALLLFLSPFESNASTAINYNKKETGNVRISHDLSMLTFEDSESLQIELPADWNGPPYAIYTGKAIKPKVHIRDLDKELIEGKDYQLSYQDNLNIGYATIDIYGMGDYEGHAYKLFRIVPKVSLKQKEYIYNGKMATPEVLFTDVNGKEIDVVKREKEGWMSHGFSIKYENNEDVGTALAKVTLYPDDDGDFACWKLPFTIRKAANPIKLKTKKVTVKASRLKKKSQSISAKKIFKTCKAKGKKTFFKISGNKKIKISKKGKLILKKGLKKGMYKVRLRMQADGGKNYKSSSKNVVLKVHIR